MATDWREEFSKQFDKYVMHGRFREYNFMDDVVTSDRMHNTNYGVEILTDWICNLGFMKGYSQDTETLEDLFLRLDRITQESICGNFLHLHPDRAREIFIDCLMHIENTDEDEMEG